VNAKGTMPEKEAGMLIRLYRDEDKAGVASLYSTVFGDSAWRAFNRRWRWQFVSNPACEAMESLMWVAELEGEIVGFLASFPTRLKLIEKVAVVRFPCDLMVSDKARGRGVGGKLIRAYIETESLLLNALGYSPPAGRMYHRLGYQEVDAESLRMRPCDTSPIIRDSVARHLRWRGTDFLVSGFAASIGGILNVGLKTVNWAKRPKKRSGIDFIRFTDANADFDHLWNRLQSKFQNLAVRDRRWVQWRFLDDPGFEHVLLGATDQRDNRLLGYIDVRASDRRGLRFGRILDLFCDPGEPDLAESLLAAGIEQLAAEKVDVITSLGHLPALQQVIAKYLYLTPRRMQRPAMFLWKGDAEEAAAVYDAERWHLTHADGDDCFSP
jgi:GNAT superfamily N-acetyltransferase